MARITINDGGRPAGASAKTRDCVTRAIAVATGLGYERVAADLDALAARERPNARRRRSNHRTGVHKATYDKYLRGLGWRFVPTMRIGSGCTVHLSADELPAGILLVKVSRHMTVVIDGVIHDTGDPSRDGTRCVYGFYVPTARYDAMIRWRDKLEYWS